MRTLTLAEAAALPAGSPVPQLKGQVKVIFDPKSGTNAHGDWTIQGFILTDGATELACKLMNHPPMDPTWRHKTVYIMAAPGKKEGTTKGVQMDVYKDKPELKIMESATVTLADGAATSEAPDQNEPPARQSQPSTPPAAPAAPARPAQPATPAAAKPAANTEAAIILNLTEAKKELCRYGNALRMAADQTLQVMESFAKAHGFPWENEHRLSAIQTILEHMTETTFTTMAIRLDKRLLVDNLPISHLDEYIERAKNQGAKAAEEQKERERQEKIAKAKQMAEEAARLAKEAEKAAAAAEAQ